MDFLQGLNNAQRQAAESGDGPALIIAGPGTGKTKTLTARIAFLVASGRARPDEILALTFTNKAAAEMRQRVGELLGRLEPSRPAPGAALGAAGALPAVSTFHALGYEIVRRAQNSELQFISENDRAALLKSLPKSAELKGLGARELSLAVSRAKNTAHAGITGTTRTKAGGGEVASGRAIPGIEPPLLQFVERYNQALQEAGLHDFDDLLCKTHALLAGDDSLRREVQARHQYILVDEFQDSSELQYLILQLIRNNENIFVIGDPLQSIYGFRGAGGHMFERFRADFAGHQAVTLTVNYRSAAPVVAMANAVFANTPQLTAHGGRPGQVRAVQTLNEYSEAAYILDQIEQGIGGSSFLKTDARHEGGRRFNDYAVLYRTHQTAQALRRQLAENGIPYQVVGEGSPYEQPEIQAIIALLRALQSGNRKNLAKHAALKDFSVGQIEHVLAGLAGPDGLAPGGAVSKLAGDIVAGFNLAGDDGLSGMGGGRHAGQKRRDLAQFIGTLVRFDPLPDGLAACLRHFDKLAEDEFYDAGADAVTLMTIHASKGLEFTHVFVIGVEDGIMPKIRKNSEPDIAEEQRLFYVAATRAKERLDLIHAKQRAGQPAALSRFARAIPQDILPRTADPNLAQLEKKLQKRRQRAAQATLF